MVKTHRGQSLQFKMMLFIIMAAFYPILLLSFLGVYNYHNIIKNRFINYAEGNANMIASYIDYEVLGMDRAMRNVMGNQSLYEMTSDKPQMDASPIEQYLFKRQFDRFMATTLFSSSNFDVAGMIFDVDASMMYLAKQAGIIHVDGIPVETLMATVDQTNRSQFLIHFENGLPNIYIAQRVLDKDTFRPIGILFFRMHPNRLSEILSVNPIEPASTRFLYTHEGLMLSKLGDFAGGMIETKGYYQKPDAIYTEQDGLSTYYIVTQKIEVLDLSVITLISDELLTVDLRRMTDLIIILSLLNIPVYLLFSRLFNQSIGNPIKDLTHKMQLFEQGELKTITQTKRKDEIGYLYQSFNRMTNSINQLIKDVYLKELARKDAEIAALQEQINPHFLYNTLESINWRAQLAGENDIADMIQALSKLMDAGINRDQNPYIPLSEELNYMAQYMFLIKMRYQDRIQFQLDVEEGIQSVMVPKMIIQPILENAVKHGIEPIGAGIISIKAYLNEAHVIIEITDDGQGMLSPKKKMLEGLFEKERTYVGGQVGKHGSIGLQNVARRLYLIYHDQADIHLDSTYQKGTKVQLRIPIGGVFNDPSLQNSNY